MKRIFTRKLLLSAAACLLSAAAFASDYTDPASGLEFTLNKSDNTATVTAKGSGTYSGAITIPATVTDKNEVTYNVTEIADNAFLNSLITSVIIEEGVTSIGETAFYNCTKLETVYLPKSLKKLGCRAFQKSTNIVGVYIEDVASYCAIEPLGSSTMGAQYTNFPLNINATSGKNKNGKNKYLYVKGENGTYEKTTELVIPEGVTSICKYAFYNYTNLTKVTFPKSLKSIGNQAFFKCTSLNSIQITDLTKWCEVDMASRIGNTFFLYDKDGKEITKLTIPDDVTKIGAYTFQSKSLTEVIIPNSVKEIGVDAFNPCVKVKAVYFLGDKEPTFGNKLPFSTSVNIYYPKYKDYSFSSLHTSYNKTACEYVDVTSAGWATGCFTADATVPDGTTAYYASDRSNNSVTLTELPTTTDGQTIVPAKEGFVYNAEEGRHLFVPSSTTTTLSGNHLTGVKFGGDAATVEAKSVYVLNTDTDGNPIFRLYNKTEIAANHAYLKAEEQGSAKADVLSFSFGEPTAITQPETTPKATDAPIYNLQGQRIMQAQRGSIYIQNGKKYIAR